MSNSWIALFLSAVLLASATPAVAAPVPATPRDLCAPQQAAVDQLRAEIQAHNNKPHTFTPAQRAQAAAYDAEARALNARRGPVNANLKACVKAMQTLQGAIGSPLGLVKPPPDVEAALRQAQNRLPSGWTPPPPPSPANRNWKARGTPVDPLFDVLRKGNPGELGNIRLQGVARPKIGDRDPAYPAGSGKVIGTNADGNSKVSPDHIIPLSQLVNLPGFTKLTPQQMYALSRAPLNFQWLSPAANLSKQSRSAAFVSGADPAWVRAQQALEQQTLKKLEDIIAKLLKINGG